MELDELEKYRGDIKKCFRCNLCKMVPLPLIKDTRFIDNCPISKHYHFHGYSGSGLQFIAHSLIDNRLKASEEMAEIVFSCRSCGYCDVACKSTMDAERTQVIQTLKEYMAEEGYLPESSKQTIKKFEQPELADRQFYTDFVAWAQEQGIKVMPAEKADILLYAGELEISKDYRETLKKAALLLKVAKVDFGVLVEEPPSGIEAYWAGHRGTLVKQATSTRNQISTLGIKTVITTSGTSLGMLRAKYYDYGIDFDNTSIFHITEFLCELINSKKLTLSKPVKGKATYHDPCFLGRQSERTERWQGEAKKALGQFDYQEPVKPIRYGSKGVYDAPRQLLTLIPGLEFTEMYRIKEHAFCCGYGGGGNKEYSDLISSTATGRLEEAQSVGAEILVSSCSYCEKHFRENQETDQNSELQITDIIDLVFKSAI